MSKKRYVLVTDSGNKSTPFDGIAYVYSSESPHIPTAKANGTKLIKFREVSPSRDALFEEMLGALKDIMNYRQYFTKSRARQLEDLIKEAEGMEKL